MKPLKYRAARHCERAHQLGGETAMEFMKAGSETAIASDYPTKPFELDDLKQSIFHAISKLHARRSNSSAGDHGS
jgi:hypothetical protein